MKKKRSGQSVNAAPEGNNRKTVPEAKQAGEKQAVEQAAAQEAVLPAYDRGDKLLLAAFALLLFCGILVISGRATMVWLGLGIVLGVVALVRKGTGAMQEHLCLPVWGLLALVGMTGAAMIYSPFNDLAGPDGYIQLGSMGVAVLILLFYRRHHVKGMLWIYLAVVSFISFICVDLASTEVISGAFISVMELLEINYKVSAGVINERLNGIIKNANVTSSLFSLGMFVGLHKLRTEEKRSARLIAAWLLGINAMAFWMSMSRGAILCFGAALVVYLFATEKGKRIRLFLLMCACVAATVVLATAAGMYLGLGSVIPDAMTLVCGLVIFAVDSLLGDRIAALLEGRGKLLAIAAGVLAVVCAAFLVAAFNIRSAYTLPESGEVVRVVDIDGGDYTISGRWDAGMTVKIYAEKQEDLLMDSGEILYEGDLTDGLPVSIPEGAKVVLMTFYGEPGQTLYDMTFSDGTPVNLNLKLIPEALEHRLQDPLRYSASSLLRIQYMKDALKIWSMKPLFGFGLSSTQGMYTAVQPVFYQSMYIHNHVLQYMTDMGICGLAAFLALMGGALWMVLRRLRAERGDALAAMFVAAWAMMNLHGLMEISFSLRVYLSAALSLVCIMIVAYGEPLKIKGKKALQSAAALTVLAFVVVELVFFGVLTGYRTAMRMSSGYKSQDKAEFMAKLEDFIAWNAVDDTYHKMVYVANGTGTREYHEQASRYAMALRKEKTFTALVGVAEYYYLPFGELGEVFALSNEGIAQKAADSDSWNMQLDFYRDTVLHAIGPERMTDYLEGVLSTMDYLAEYEVGRYERIRISDDNQRFVADVREAYQSGMPSEEAYLYLAERWPAKEK